MNVNLGETARSTPFRRWGEVSRPLLSAAGAALGLSWLTADPAVAQGFERYLPETTLNGASSLALPQVEVADASHEGFGVVLRSITLLGPRDPVQSRAVRPVDLSRLPRVAGSGLDQRLESLIGEPLSPALIATIESEIVTAYRAAGYPFVAVSTPPQEITGGLLNLRVVEFSAGVIAVRGAGRMPQEQVLAGVRQETGQPIEAATLEQDLAWLNRSPFRRVTAEFSPGASLGFTDLTLDLRESRRWSLRAGYANSGAQATGRDRFSAGFGVGDLVMPGSVLAYLLTASPDAFGPGPASYVGHALQASLPFAPRQELGLTLGLTETNETAGAFDTRIRTDELSLSYRAALSNFVSLPGDLLLGFEHRGQQREVFFGPPPPITADRVAARQFVFGWNTTRSRPRGRTDIDLRLSLSPGGLGAANTSAAMAAYTAGRVTNARYGYLSMVLDHEQRLPRPGHDLAFRLVGQLASGALPVSEQFVLGGAQAVRGYVIEDGAFDSMLLLRSEYRFPASRRENAVIRPIVFGDAGIGRDIGMGTEVRMASLGFGVAVGIGNSGTGEISVAHSLVSAPATPVGTTRLNVSLTVRY